MHLKVIQQMSRVPRSVGIPPLSDSSFEQAFTSQALANAAPNNALMPTPGSSSMGWDEDDSRVNPLAGMGLTDEQYNMILQNIVNGESFMGGMNGGGMGDVMGGAGDGMSREKRALEDSSDGREGKRSRFEVVE